MRNQQRFYHLTPLLMPFDFIVQYHPAFTGQHHEAVYILLLRGVCEGPTFISYTTLKRTLAPFIRGTLRRNGSVIYSKCPVQKKLLLIAIPGIVLQCFYRIGKINKRSVPVDGYLVGGIRTILVEVSCLWF